MTGKRKYWNRCDECGKLISIQDFSYGRALKRLLTPDSDRSREEYETLCKDHAPRMDKLTPGLGWLKRATEDAAAYIRLRDAAPDMYEALYRLDSALEAAMDGNFIDANAALSEGRAALSKARGE